MMNEWSEEIFNLPFNYENVKTDTEFHLSIDGDTVMICFHGSTTLIDWVFNLRLLTTPYREMKELFYVHTGFLKKWKSVQKEILSFVSESGKKKVKIRGHSQGGAVAILCHENISFRFPDIVLDTVTFGCPRVFGRIGNEVISERCKSVVRVINGSDFVPKIPFEFVGYKHVGVQVNIGEKSILGYTGIDHRNNSYMKACKEYDKINCPCS